MKQLFFSLVMLWMTAPAAAAQTGTATVTGRLMNDEKPAVGVRVIALDATENGSDQNATVQRIVGIAETDASGRYRLTDLAPGRYYIGAGLLDTPAYYPRGASAATATIITVAAGSVVADIDFTITPLSLGLTVSGRLVTIQLQCSKER